MIPFRGIHLPSANSQLTANGLILLSTVFWGLAYVVVKDAIARVDVFVFLCQRFSLAFLLTLPLCRLNRENVNRQTILQGLVMGLLLFGSYSSATIGLQYTTATNSSFLTSLHVVFVPLLGALFYKEHIPTSARWGALFCFSGLFLLCSRGEFSLSSFNKGELWIVLGALCIAFRIIYTSRFVRESNVTWLTAIQLGTVAVLTAFGAPLRGHSILEWRPDVAWALIFCAVFATVLTFMVLNSMQRFTSPVHVALIFCMEPVFTAIFGYYLAGETMTPVALMGAGMVLVGMVLSEIPPAVLRKFFTRSPKLPGRSAGPLHHGPAFKNDRKWRVRFLFPQKLTHKIPTSRERQ